MGTENDNMETGRNVCLGTLHHCN